MASPAIAELGSKTVGFEWIVAFMNSANAGRVAADALRAVRQLPQELRSSALTALSDATRAGIRTLAADARTGDIPVVRDPGPIGEQARFTSFADATNDVYHGGGKVKGGFTRVPLTEGLQPIEGKVLPDGRVLRGRRILLPFTTTGTETDAASGKTRITWLRVAYQWGNLDYRSSIATDAAKARALRDGRSAARTAVIESAAQEQRVANHRAMEAAREAGRSDAEYATEGFQRVMSIKDDRRDVFTDANYIAILARMPWVANHIAETRELLRSSDISTEQYLRSIFHRDGEITRLIFGEDNQIVADLQKAGWIIYRNIEYVGEADRLFESLARVADRLADRAGTYSSRLAEAEQELGPALRRLESRLQEQLARVEDAERLYKDSDTSSNRQAMMDERNKANSIAQMTQHVRNRLANANAVFAAYMQAATPRAPARKIARHAA